MGKSGENITADEDAAPAERHPHLSADFDERLRAARQQREKVLAERAAAATATDEASPPPVTISEQSALDTHATQDVPQIETHPVQSPIAATQGLYRHPKWAVGDSDKNPQAVTRPLKWFASGALAGLLVGSVGTVIILEARSTGYEADIVSRAASQPDVSWPMPSGPTTPNVSMVPDRSLRIAVPRTDVSIGKSRTTAVTLRPSPDTSSPDLAVRSSQSALPVVQLRMPNLGADPSGTNVDVSVFPVAEPQGMARAEPLQPPQGLAVDGKPSVDLGSLAPTLATWDAMMTAPRQDQPQQASPPLLKSPDRVTHQPVLRWSAPKDDFNCQDCQMTALPAQDQTVILFMSDASSTQQRDIMMSRLSSLGLANVEPHQIRLGASETNVRYFHNSDAAAARAVARSTDARLVDLSALRPSPPVGTIELRLGPDRSNIAESNQISSDIKG